LDYKSFFSAPSGGGWNNLALVFCQLRLSEIRRWTAQGGGEKMLKRNEKRDLKNFSSWWHPRIGNSWCL